MPLPYFSTFPDPTLTGNAAVSASAGTIHAVTKKEKREPLAKKARRDGFGSLVLNVMSVAAKRGRFRRHVVKQLQAGNFEGLMPDPARRVL
jgi:hypothetical protein